MMWLVCLGAATSVALLCIAGLAHLRAPAPPSPAAPELPGVAPAAGIWRFLQRPLGLLIPLIVPLMKGRAGRVFDRQLARAELDAFIETNTWAALNLLCLLLAASLAASLCLLLPRQAVPYLATAALGVLLAPWLWLLERGKRTRLSVQHELPACLDTLTLALEAGCAFGAALQLMVERSADSPLRRAWQRCQQEMRAGRPRREALERLGQRLAVPALSATIAAIIQAELTGVSLAPVIRAQAVRGTQERFARAEKRALEAPIRMLAPLVICIFPCTFIVIGFPIAATLLWGA